MRLYDAAWAPSPRRVRIYLAEKGIAVDRVAIDLRANEQLGDAYLAVNAAGTVPTLVLDDGEAIADSVAICRYFEALHPDPPMFGSDAIGTARVETWIRATESLGYTAAVYAFRNGAPGFADRGLAGAWPTVAQIPALVDRARTLWTRYATMLDAQLARSAWVAGDDYTFADVMALTTVDFARSARLPIPADAAAVARWHATASARPSAAA